MSFRVRLSALPPVSFRAKREARRRAGTGIGGCRISALSLCLSLAACSAEPVAWTSETAYKAASALVITASGDTIPDSTFARLSGIASPAAACPASLRVVTVGRTLVGVWWSARADSGARLLSARSADAGRSWSAPTPVDTVDRGVSGCRRPAPSIAADSASGYVHVSYGLVAPEGTGIFFAHSMDRGVTFHAPVAIVYGDRLGATSVAASGDVVAVAFEDPSGRASRVGLALSHTMGHIFEDRLMPVSDDNGAAAQPSVAVAGRRIAIAWREGTDPRGDAVLRVRTGNLH